MQALQALGKEPHALQRLPEILCSGGGDNLQDAGDLGELPGAGRR